MPQVDEKSCGREHPMTHLIKRVELTQIMNNSEILQSGSFIDTPGVYCLILNFYRIFILHSNLYNGSNICDQFIFRTSNRVFTCMCSLEIILTYILIFLQAREIH